MAVRRMLLNIATRPRIEAVFTPNPQYSKR